MSFIRPDRVVPGSPADVEAGRLRFYMLGPSAPRLAYLQSWAECARRNLVEASRVRHFTRAQAGEFAEGYAQAAVWLAELAELDDLQAETFVSLVQQGLYQGLEVSADGV